MTLDKFRLLQIETKQRNKPRHIESRIQQSVVNWFRYQHPNYIIAAIPNGGFRNAREAAIMQREGVLAGFSDLIIIAERKVLFMEMKAYGGKQSKAQEAFQDKVCKLGHNYVVSYSLEDAILNIERWLKTIALI